MSRGKQSKDWDHTAALLTMTANINRDKKQQPRPFTMDNFHPFPESVPAKRTTGIPLKAGNIHILKALIPK